MAQGGVLTPHAAAGPETELPDMASGRVVAVVTRIRPPGIAADRGLGAALSDTRPRA